MSLFREKVEQEIKDLEKKHKRYGCPQIKRNIQTKIDRLKDNFRHPDTSKDW